MQYSPSRIPGVSPNHAVDLPSGWVARWARLIPAGGRVLDLAAGSGRHARFLARAGYEVEAVDRDGASLSSVSGLARVKVRVADLEGGPWPYAGEKFAGIVATNYLHRPLFPLLAEALAAGGVLIYETFMLGNERYGRPSNPDFLLEPGELLQAFSGSLQVVAYEAGAVTQPKQAVIQRLCAARSAQPLPVGACRSWD